MSGTGKNEWSLAVPECSRHLIRKRLQKIGQCSTIFGLDEGFYRHSGYHFQPLSRFNSSSETAMRSV